MKKAQGPISTVIATSVFALLGSSCVPVGDGGGNNGVNNGGGNNGGGGSKVWRIEIVDGSFPDTKGDGSGWDALGGAPDPYVCIKTVNRSEYCTPTRQDTYNPSWLQRSPYVYTTEQIAEVRLLIFDEDRSEDDLASSGTVSLWGLTSATTIEASNGVSVKMRVIEDN